MNEEVITSESELYNQIVEMLSNGNFLQLNGKAINLTELNEYINAQQKEIERLQDLCNKYEKEHKTTYEIWKKDIYLYNSLVDRIDKAIEYIEENKRTYENDEYCFDDMIDNVMPLLDILKGVDKE